VLVLLVDLLVPRGTLGGVETNALAAEILRAAADDPELAACEVAQGLPPENAKAAVAFLRRVALALEERMLLATAKPHPWRARRLVGRRREAVSYTT
jgi:prophage DNA circulation protein